MKPEEVALFSHLVARPEAELDLVRAVLLIAEPEYPELDVLPLCADFIRPLSLPRRGNRPARAVVYFPGSTIGNFDPPEADALLRRVAGLVGPGGGLLLGVDLQKPVDVLERAYNDAAGVTAAFNRNVLERIRRELDSDIDPSALWNWPLRTSHAARYVSSLAASISIAMSASLNATPWLSMIGRPNWVRSFA